MKIRLDKFTLAVLAVVGVLLVAAIVTVNRVGGVAQEDYRTADAPETPVFNAFLALQNGDISTARAQYSEKVLDEVNKQGGYGPLRGETYYRDNRRRMRLLSTTINAEDADRAYVTVALDNYNSGGLFNRGSTWTSERVVEVVREAGEWKINVQEYFY